MEQFRKYLKEEGIDTEERVQINLKVQFPNSFEDKGLLVIKPKIRDEFVDVEQLVLSVDDKLKPKIDIRSTIEVEVSDDRVKDHAAVSDSENRIFIDDKFLPLLDFERLFREAWHYRSQKGYGNLSFNTENLREIIKGRLYELYCDEDLLQVNSFSDVKRLEEIALIIIRKYIDSWYKRKQQEWEYKLLEYHPFKEDNRNIPHYARSEERRVGKD